MPQGSLISEMELHAVTVKLRVDEVKQLVTCDVRATNRTGALLRSSGIVAQGMLECELLPHLLHDVALGFLYRGPNEAVTVPCRGFREARRAIRH